MTVPRTPGRLGYLVRAFPRVSETFIINEILELERQRFDLRVYSMIHPTDAIRHRLVDEIRSPIRYLPNVWRAPGTVIADHCRCLALAPRSYATTLRHAVTTGDLGLIARFAQAPSLVRMLKADAVTHLHAGFIHTPGSLAYLASMLSGVPYSLATHARDLYRASPALLRKKLADAQVVFTCTRYNVGYLQRLLDGKAVRIQHAYHGINLERFGCAPCGGNQPPVILAVARLVEKKGLEDLIHACAILRGRSRCFSCHIIGTGVLKAPLLRLIRRLGLDGTVTLEGALEQEAVIAWYRRATLMALPCLVARDGDRDGIPNVLIEAAACGIPIVTTPVSGIPELVADEESGLLVRPRDPAALANAIDRLLQSADLRERVRANARKTVEELFDLQRNALTIGRELRAVMNRQAGQPMQESVSRLLGSIPGYRSNLGM